MLGHENHTFSNDFILLGLFTSSQASLVFFSFIFTIFVLTVTENTVMILIIHRELRLHTPMYFLLSHLSFMDLAYFQHCSQNEYWFPVRQQNYFICSLWHPDICIPHPLGWWVPSPGSNVLWSLCSHLSPTALPHAYEWLCQRSHGWRGLVYWDNQLHSSHSLHTSLSLLWLKSHWPLFLWSPCYVGVVLCGHNTLWTRSLCKWHHFPACPFLSNLCILCPNSPYRPPNEIIRGLEKVIFYLFLPHDCSHNVLWAIYFHIHET